MSVEDEAPEICKPQPYPTFHGDRAVGFIDQQLNLLFTHPSVGLKRAPLHHLHTLTELSSILPFFSHGSQNPNPS